MLLKIEVGMEPLHHDFEASLKTLIDHIEEKDQGRNQESHSANDEMMAQRKT